MFAISKTGASTASFSIMYTNKKSGTFNYITSTAENQGIVSYSVNTWNWNNGVSNTISLACTNGVWRWTANGQELVPAEGAADYSNYIAEVYTTFTSANKTATIQIYGGKNMVYNISSIAEYVENKDPVATTPSLAASYKTGETLSLTLSQLFTDPNGDSLVYVMGDDCEYGSIENGVYTFTPAESGKYTVVIEAYDGKGGQATLTFEVNVVAADSGNAGGNDSDETSTSASPVESANTNDSASPVESASGESVKEGKSGCGSALGNVVSVAATLMALAAVALIVKKNKSEM
jgi:hypothetical protein